MDSCERHNLITILSCILGNVVRHQDEFISVSQITPFTALCEPSISIHDYLERILKYSNCSAECLVLSLIYIDRLIQSGTIPVNSLTVHRVIITSVMIAIKFFDDSFCVNSFYAQIGGVQTEELNNLEMVFLKSINFTLLVTCDDYQKYHNELYLHVRNGFCSSCCHCSIPPLEMVAENSDIVLRYSPKKAAFSSPRNVVQNLCEDRV